MAPPASTTHREDWRLTLAAVADCPPIDVESTISITISPDGSVARLETPGMPVTTATCVVAAVRAVAFSPRSRQDIVRVHLDPVAAVAGSSAPTGSARPDVPAPSAAETAARARADELRAAILACTSSEAAALVVDWTAEGALTVRLPDARSGTPEDGCVRALFAGATLTPPPGAAGSILHAVH